MMSRSSCSRSSSMMVGSSRTGRRGDYGKGREGGTKIKSDLSKDAKK